jgi:hypothetical protein
MSHGSPRLVPQRNDRKNESGEIADLLPQVIQILDSSEAADLVRPAPEFVIPDAPWP